MDHHEEEQDGHHKSDHPKDNDENVHRTGNIVKAFNNAGDHIGGGRSADPFDPGLDLLRDGGNVIAGFDLDHD